MSHAHPPAWSVVVPTFNRPERLDECVNALSSLHSPDGGFEIIIVNDGGLEPTAAVRAAASRGTATSASFLTQTNSGPAAARNRGAEHARGLWLAFTDDDCAPHPDWLLALGRALAHAPDALAGGTVRNALSENMFSEASQRLAEYTAAYFDGTGRKGRFFTSNNMAVARATFSAAGGFNASFGRSAGEDREFCDRWHAQGRPSVFQPDALVQHAHDLTVTSFLRQHVAYGRGAQSFRAIRRDAGRPVRIDPAFYLGSLRHARHHRPLLQGAILTFLTAAAHSAYLTGLVMASLRPGTHAPLRGVASHGNSRESSNR